MRFIVPILSSIFLCFTVVNSALAAGDSYTPQRGSAERKAILDAVRPSVEADLLKPIEFVVTSMKVANNWAFVVVEPQRPGGRPIDIRKTPVAADADFFDGFTTYALVNYNGSRWISKAVVIGPTDVAWEPWAEQFGAPSHLMFQ
ncbi:hypothetical protein [Cohaesibacter celericrescens]|uniref:Uncharacterized protein n=1 Tax=Cohaesibacter celericrescens TaxID=2067669 RepID=A0A2N5XNV6_9HYPH|nr:hypothetical protein [Cohaesibacter celericrescens]PLW76221.1 hypothetical protein C0081_15050 [Cohaesibacter celericrescens]